MAALFRHWAAYSGSSRFRRAMAVMLSTAFMGVRMSWDMADRKLVFASLACLASRAVSRSCRLTHSRCQPSRSTSTARLPQMTSTRTQALSSVTSSASGRKPTMSSMESSPKEEKYQKQFSPRKFL